MNLLETLAAMGGFSAKKNLIFHLDVWKLECHTHSHTTIPYSNEMFDTSNDIGAFGFLNSDKKQNKLINHIDTAAKRRMLDMYTFERWKRKEKQIISIQWIVQRSEREKIEYRRIFNMFRNAPYAMHKNWFLFCCCRSSLFFCSAPHDASHFTSHRVRLAAKHALRKHLGLNVPWICEGFSCYFVFSICIVLHW